MSGFEMRLASEVLHWPKNPSPRWRPPRCPMCRSPFRQGAEVYRVPNMGWVHPYCAATEGEE